MNDVVIKRIISKLSSVGSICCIRIVIKIKTSTVLSEKIVFDGLKHDDSIAVTLSNISKNYYNYLVLRNESGSLYNQLNLEPLNYPTNVVNGYGFFNAHIPDIYFDDLSLY